MLDPIEDCIGDGEILRMTVHQIDEDTGIESNQAVLGEQSRYLQLSRSFFK